MDNLKAILDASGAATGGRNFGQTHVLALSTTAVDLPIPLEAKYVAFSCSASFFAQEGAGADVTPTDVAGYQTALFSSAKVGATLTGLAAATAGLQAVGFTSSKVGTSSTGLAVSTSGYKQARFAIDKETSSPTGLVAGVTYTAAAVIDGGASQPISIAGASAPTFFHLINELNADLTGATAFMFSGGIRVRSDTTGTTSTIAITDTNLFSSLGATLLTSVAGADTPTYTAAIVVDGGSSQPIAVDGDDAQTYTELLAALNSDITGATAAMLLGKLVVTSDTTGVTSTIAITDTDLFESLSDFVEVETAVDGLAAPDYEAAVTADGGSPTAVSISGDDAQTYTALLTALNTDLTGVAVATLVNGNLRVTSATGGVGSSIEIEDDTLFDGLTDFTGFATPQGGMPGVGPELNPGLRAITPGTTVLSCVALTGTPTLTVTYFA